MLGDLWLSSIGIQEKATTGLMMDRPVVPAGCGLAD